MLDKSGHQYVSPTRFAPTHCGLSAFCKIRLALILYPDPFGKTKLQL
jgi:hypothetical protein